MLNKKNKNYLKILILSLFVIIFCVSAIPASAEEGTTENNLSVTENTNSSQLPEAEENSLTEKEEEPIEENVFAEIYELLELNADKIFSALAFIGTLIVSFSYKKGLIPLLAETFSRFRGTLDGIKKEGELRANDNSEMFSSINLSLKEMEEAINKCADDMTDIKEQFATYDDVMKEREAMKLILDGQIDMLYNIFMSSSLPHFQKEEIGNKIVKMREELSKNEQKGE